MRLFAAGGIALDTVVLHPLVGASFAALNYRRLGDRAAMQRTLRRFMAPAALMAIAQISLRVVMWPGPTGAVWWTYAAFVFGIKFAMAWLLYREQKPIVTKHVEDGGQKSGFSFKVAGALFLFVVFILLFLAMWQFLSPTHPTPAARRPSRSATAH